MLNILLFLHSTVRWLVLSTMLLSIYKSCKGRIRGLPYTKTDDAIRHWTATTAHIQLMIGILLYSQSPNARFTSRVMGNGQVSQPFFFGVVHMVLMVSAIVIITIGSAIAKRQPTDEQKFKTMLVWFGLALFIIIIAIPWPFSPLVQRPYLRSL